MKSKQEIYNNTVELIEKQDKANYLAYYKVFLENSSSFYNTFFFSL